MNPSTPASLRSAKLSEDCPPELQRRRAEQPVELRLAHANPCSHVCAVPRAYAIARCEGGLAPKLSEEAPRPFEAFAPRGDEPAQSLGGARFSNARAP